MNFGQNWNNIKRSRLFGLFFLLLLGFGCKPDNPDDLDFNRAAMLTNVGDNIILPNYRSLKDAVVDLESKAAAFTTSLTIASLEEVQTSWKEAARAWQGCSPFEFGPAMDVSLRASVNTFPADTAQIHSNIAATTYDLESASNIDAKGFPALDYLLFGLGSDAASILSQYDTALDAADRRDYLNALVTDVKNRIETVVNDWESSGGNYIASFKNDDGTSVGSNTGSFVNQLNFDWELIKNPKIGIPLGKKTLGQVLPENVEAYYSGISAELATLNAKTIRTLYNGGTGMGLEENLDQVEAMYNGASLSPAINSLFDNAIAALEAIPDPLSATIVNNPAIVDAAYTEIQKTIVLIKTDMPSALGVLITYQDNDGD